MLIKSEFDVTESPDKVWEFFNNIPLVASCLPGADISEEVAEDEYKAYYNACLHRGRKLLQASLLEYARRRGIIRPRSDVSADESPTS